MCYCVTPESAQPYETAYLAASGKMMPAATASLAELRYALLTSLSVLGAAEAVTSGCSMRAQLIALVGMTLAASAGLAELRYALLRYVLLPSLSVLGAAEAATVCSVRAQLIALVGMTLTATPPQPAWLSFDTRCLPRFLCLGRQRPPPAAQCVRS